MILNEGETVKLPPYITAYRGVVTGDRVEGIGITYVEVSVKVSGGTKLIMIDHRDLEVIGIAGAILDSKPATPETQPTNP